MGWNFKMITVQMKRELEKKKISFFPFNPAIYFSFLNLSFSHRGYLPITRIRAITNRLTQFSFFFFFFTTHATFSSIKNNFKSI